MKNTTAAPSRQPELSVKSSNLLSEEIIAHHVYAALGVGLLPVPLFDFVAITWLQLNLTRKLAALYNIPFSQNKAKIILPALVGGGLSAEVGWRILFSISKILPGPGLSLLGATGSGLFSAASIYAVGKVFDRHFAEGGTMRDFNSQKAKSFYQEMVKEGRSVASELKKSGGKTVNSALQEKEQQSPSLTEGADSKPIQPGGDDDPASPLFNESAIPSADDNRESAEPAPAEPTGLAAPNDAKAEVKLVHPHEEAAGTAENQGASAIVDENGTPVENDKEPVFSQEVSVQEKTAELPTLETEAAAYEEHPALTEELEAAVGSKPVQLPDEEVLSEANELHEDKNEIPSVGNNDQKPEASAQEKAESVLSSQGVSITDILFQGGVKRGQSDEYIEITNNSTCAVDISGWQITPFKKNKIFIFPDGTSLAPGQSFRVYTNEIHAESGGFSFGSKTAVWRDLGGIGFLHDADGREVSKFAYGDKEACCFSVQHQIVTT